MASGLSIELGQIEQTLRNWVKTFDAAKVNAEEIGEREEAQGARSRSYRDISVAPPRAARPTTHETGVK
jgi:hypothetical protein